MNSWASRTASGTGLPLASAAALAAVAGLGATVALRKRRLPPRIAPGDLVLVAAATAKLSRLLSREPVTAPLRAPFTRLEHKHGEGDLVERVRGNGVQRTLG